MPRPLRLVNLLWLLVSCRAAAPTQPQPQPQPQTTASPKGSPTPTRSATAEPPDATEPAAGLPHTCELELELLVPSRAQGHGTSDTSPDAAKESAWTQACAELRKSADLDCQDDRYVGIISQKSSTLRSVRNTGVAQSHFEFELVLGARRTAKGFGDAVEDRKEACHRAKQHACMQLVGGPCPDKGVRVIAVDGKPPRPATVEPSAGSPPTRPTI